MNPHAFWRCTLLHPSWLPSFIIAMVAVNVLPVSSCAQTPEWWVSRGVLKPGALADNLAALNAGQFKHAVSQAVAETNAELAAEGGAGMELNTLITSWTNGGSGVDNYELVNVGQVKAVLKLWYDRLNEVHGTTGYPWSAVQGEENYEVVNLGQLKKLLQVDVRLPWTHNLAQGWTLPGSLDNLDFDGDGLSHSQELLLGLSPFNVDSDGDSLQDADEADFGLDLALNDMAQNAAVLQYNTVSRLVQRAESGVTQSMAYDKEGNLIAVQ